VNSAHSPLIGSTRTNITYLMVRALYRYSP